MPDVPHELRTLLEATTLAQRDEAWGRFVDRFSPLLLHTARKAVRERDLAMDAYAYLLENLRDGDCDRLRRYGAQPDTQFTTWLVVVARRLCLDHLRQRYGRFRSDGPTDAARVASRRHLVDLVAEELDRAGPLPDPRPGAHERLVHEHQRAALEECLSERTAAERLLLSLRFEDDHSAREIAKILRYPTAFHVYRAINAVLKQLHRALARRGVTGSGV